jgi:ferritin-like metal-binding protein YciE
MKNNNTNTLSKPTENGLIKIEKDNSNKKAYNVEQGLRDLFVEGLKEIYWVHDALIKVMPRMIKKATADTLTEAWGHHFVVTKGHIIQLNAVFACMSEKVRAKKCEPICCLIKEAEEIMDNTGRGMVRDAALISVGKKMAHYQIAAYETLCAMAKILGEAAVFSLLQETLYEEKEADKTLSVIAHSFSNSAIVGANKDSTLNGAHKLESHKALVNNQEPDILHAYLTDKQAFDVKTIRIIDVQLHNQSAHDLKSVQVTPLSININF